MASNATRPVGVREGQFEAEQGQEPVGPKIKLLVLSSSISQSAISPLIATRRISRDRLTLAGRRSSISESNPLLVAM